MTLDGKIEYNFFIKHKTIWNILRQCYMFVVSIVWFFLWNSGYLVKFYENLLQNERVLLYCIVCTLINFWSENENLLTWKKNSGLYIIISRHLLGLNFFCCLLDLIILINRQCMTDLNLRGGYENLMFFIL